MNPLANSLFSKPIGILGGGVSGVAAKQLIQSIGLEAVIYDEKPGFGDKDTFLAEHAESHALIVNSPGFPPYHPWFEVARNANCAIWGEIQLAAHFWKGPIVFVTGTNGKSTITQLLTAVLLEAGHDAFAFGNIGIPFSENVKFNPRPDAIAVVELSSFQSWNLRDVDANGLIWTNFAEDHQDWHQNMDNYFDAKWRAVDVAAHGHVVLGKEVLDIAKVKKLTIPESVECVDPAAVVYDEQLPISFINQLNLEYVKRWVGSMGISAEIVEKVAARFSFLPHRMEAIGEFEGINFWNDSKATNCHAVEAALANFYSPVIWIGGGCDKDSDLELFAETIGKEVKIAITYGMVGAKLADAFLNAGVLTYNVDHLQEAIDIVAMEAQPGDEVVLSPGFSSFDQFEGYAQRGRSFKQLVETKFFKQPKYTQHINK